MAAFIVREGTQVQAEEQNVRASAADGIRHLRVHGIAARRWRWHWHWQSIQAQS
jgi:hypothetical protein